MNEIVNKILTCPNLPSNVRLLSEVNFTITREQLTNKDEHVVRMYMFYFDVSYQNLRCNINSYINMLEKDIKEKL